jgi:hypothetical protein
MNAREGAKLSGTGEPGGLQKFGFGQGGMFSVSFLVF